MNSVIYSSLIYLQSNIFINGLPAEETREWFIKNSGYVLQLATPYHEELTVRQNLTYSAMMRLPMKMKIQDKMWRVEQVLGQVYSAITFLAGNLCNLYTCIYFFFTNLIQHCSILFFYPIRPSSDLYYNFPGKKMQSSVSKQWARF